MNSRTVTLEDLRTVWCQTAPSNGHATAEDVGLGWAVPSVVVIGASGGVGATTLALALAENLAGSRVIECRTAPLSALASATTSEHGTFVGGWQRGLREGRHHDVEIDRAPQVVTSPGDLPRPAEPTGGCGSAVIDAGWRLCELRGWLDGAVTSADAMVIAAYGTCPGLAHLEAALRELERRNDSPIVVALRGQHIRRWPRRLRAAIGTRTQRLLEQGDFVTVGENRTLQLLGLSPDSLPPALTAAGEELGRRLEPVLAATTPQNQQHQSLHLERTPS